MAVLLTPCALTCSRVDGAEIFRSVLLATKCTFIEFRKVWHKALKISNLFKYEPRTLPFSQSLPISANSWSAKG